MVSLLPFLRKLPASFGKLLIRLHARQNLHPVPNQCCAIRLGRLPKDFKEKGHISAVQVAEIKAFELSSLDKKSIPPHLSVWVDALTTPEQAYSFLPENSPCKLLLRLQVDEIRKIVGRSTDGTQHFDLLNVVWVHLTQNVNGQQVRNRRPGAEGHAGIIGLDEQSVPVKLLRKDLRSKLAELASKNCELIS
jgi:hypothetical protein